MIRHILSVLIALVIIVFGGKWLLSTMHVHHGDEHDHGHGHDVHEESMEEE